MGEISEASLLDYICSCGGKVKNSDLSKTYKHFINHNDLQLRAKYREEFKLIIDRIAVVKSENGEKYLILKKKYRQLIQEREPCAGESIKQVHPNPQNELQVSNPVQNHNPTAQKQPVMVAWCSGPMITVTEASEPTQTDNSDSTLSPPAEAEKPEHLTEELSASDREDELDKDSGSKSESEQDEDCGGSLGSTAVALDPLEKEWIFSAASGKLSHLIQLLKQDSSLANKKDFTSVICEYIIYSSLFFKSRSEYVSFGSHHKGAIWLVRVKGSPPGQNRNLRNKGRRRHILLTVVRHAEPP
ncbi:hypothetical protein PO909_014286 [Leuciscus waleckii]